MNKFQNVILYISLTISCFAIRCEEHNREWAGNFNGLKTNDPQLFVEWVHLRLNIYEERFLGFKQERELINKQLLEEKLHHFGGYKQTMSHIKLHQERNDIERIISQIVNRLNALKLRNMTDCYDVLKIRYQPEHVWGQKVVIIYIDKDPFGLENYKAFNEGREAVNKLPRIDNDNLERLLKKTEDVLIKYYSIATYNYFRGELIIPNMTQPQSIEVIID